MIVRWLNKVMIAGIGLLCCFLGVIGYLWISDLPPQCDLKSGVNTGAIQQTLSNSVKHMLPSAKLGELSVSQCTDNEEMKIGSHKISECFVGSLSYKTPNGEADEGRYGTMLFDRCGNILFDVHCGVLNC
jgi:hypothetical protein